MSSSISTPAFAEGSRLGKFRLVQRLGQGGMGEVWLAEDTTLKRNVALKVILPEFALRDDIRARFLQEARSAAQVEHERIVRILEVGEDGKVPYIAMELLKGEDLHSSLNREPVPSLSFTLKVIAQVLHGLSAAHTHPNRLIHRDIKPSNIWLEAVDGKGKFRCKILDFGIAKSSAEDRLKTQSGIVIGTLDYMSAEQLNLEELDARADLYSVGVMMYEMLTGRVPYQSRSVFQRGMEMRESKPLTPKELNFSVPRLISEFTMRMISVDRKSRPGAASTAITELEGIINESSKKSESDRVPTSQSPVQSGPAGSQLRQRTGILEAKTSPEQLPQRKLVETRRTKPATPRPVGRAPSISRTSKTGPFPKIRSRSFPWSVVIFLAGLVIILAVGYTVLNDPRLKPNKSDTSGQESVSARRAVPNSTDQPFQDASSRAVEDEPQPPKREAGQSEPEPKSIPATKETISPRNEPSRKQVPVETSPKKMPEIKTPATNPKSQPAKQAPMVEDKKQSAEQIEPKGGPIRKPEVEESSPVKDLISRLKSKDQKTRIQACIELKSRGVEAAEATSELCLAILDPSAELKEAAFEALEKVAPNFYPAISTLVLDSNPGNRFSAVRTFSKLGEAGKPFLPLITRFLQELSDREIAAGINFNLRFLQARSEALPNPEVLFQKLPGLIFLAIQRIEPNETESLKLLRRVASQENRNSDGRFDAFLFLCQLAGEDESKRKALLPLIEIGISDTQHGSNYMEKAGSFGPLAKELLPILKKLKLSSDMNIRNAATKAISLIEK